MLNILDIHLNLALTNSHLWRILSSILQISLWLEVRQVSYAHIVDLRDIVSEGRGDKWISSKWLSLLLDYVHTIYNWVCLETYLFNYYAICYINKLYVCILYIWQLKLQLRWRFGRENWNLWFIFRKIETEHKIEYFQNKRVEPRNSPSN